MSDGRWFSSDMIKDIQVIQLRICTMIRYIQPHLKERDQLISVVSKLEMAIVELEKIQQPSEKEES